MNKIQGVDIIEQGVDKKAQFLQWVREHAIAVALSVSVAIPAGQTGLAEGAQYLQRQRLDTPTTQVIAGTIDETRSNAILMKIALDDPDQKLPEPEPVDGVPFEGPGKPWDDERGKDGYDYPYVHASLQGTGKYLLDYFANSGAAEAGADKAKPLQEAKNLENRARNLEKKMNTLNPNDLQNRNHLQNQINELKNQLENLRKQHFLKKKGKQTGKIERGILASIVAAEMILYVLEKGLQPATDQQIKEAIQRCENYLTNKGHFPDADEYCK